MNTDLDLRDFDGLTSDGCGMLIGREKGILEALRPWKAGHQLELSSVQPDLLFRNLAELAESNARQRGGDYS